MSTDLIAELRAALDEEAQYATQAFADETGETLPEWHEVSSGLLEIGADVVITGDSRVSRFMERHDPAFALADIAAKRAVLDLHQPLDLEAEMILVCAECDVSDYPCPTLRLLAEAYGIRPEGTTT